jgi:hypothetical protein
MTLVSNRGRCLGAPIGGDAGGEGGSGGVGRVWREEEPSGVVAAERPGGVVERRPTAVAP